MKDLTKDQKRNSGMCKPPKDVKYYKSIPYSYKMGIYMRHTGKNSKERESFTHGVNSTGAH